MTQDIKKQREMLNTLFSHLNEARDLVVGFEQKLTQLEEENSKLKLELFQAREQLKKLGE